MFYNGGVALQVMHVDMLASHDATLDVIISHLFGHAANCILIFSIQF